MAVLLSILLWTLAVLGLVLGLILVVPFAVRVEGQVGEARVGGELRASWGFGLVGFRLSSRRRSGLTLCGLRVAGGAQRSDAERAERRQREQDQKRARREKARARRKEKRAEGRGTRGLGWMLAHRAALQRVARRLVGALGLRLELRGRLGLGDPAETASLELLVEQLARRAPGLRLELGWDYLDDVVELDGEGRARLWLLQLAGVALLLLLDREVRALLRAPVRAAAGAVEQTAA